MNQCDGCQARLPFNSWGNHYEPGRAYPNSFACTAERYHTFGEGRAFWIWHEAEFMTVRPECGKPESICRRMWNKQQAKAATKACRHWWVPVYTPVTYSLPTDREIKLTPLKARCAHCNAKNW